MENCLQSPNLTVHICFLFWEELLKNKQTKLYNFWAYEMLNHKYKKHISLTIYVENQTKKQTTNTSILVLLISLRKNQYSFL